MNINSQGTLSEISQFNQVVYPDNSSWQYVLDKLGQTIWQRKGAWQGIAFAWQGCNGCSGWQSQNITNLHKIKVLLNRVPKCIKLCTDCLSKLKKDNRLLSNSDLINLVLQNRHYLTNYHFLKLQIFLFS